MNEQPEYESQDDETESAPTQEQLYDDLRRIGQLEDQKREIQSEIDERTDRLKNAIPTLDKSSLLYQLLSKTMPVAKKATGRVVKKSTRKRK